MSDDLQSSGQGFKSYLSIHDRCRDYAPNMTRLTLNRLQRLTPGRKFLFYLQSENLLSWKPE